MSLTYRQVMHISDDHSFDMAPDIHYHRVFPGENTNGTFTLVSNNPLEKCCMSWQLDFMLSYNLTWEGISFKKISNLLNTGYLTVILSVKFFIRGNLFVFCQELHNQWCQYLCY